jgi:hypothetical protein
MASGRAAVSARDTLDHRCRSLVGTEKMSIAETSGGEL